jgi:hypothetical protein
MKVVNGPVSVIHGTKRISGSAFYRTYDPPRMPKRITQFARASIELIF